MVAGSKASPRGLQFRRWSLVVLLLCTLPGGAACSLPKGDAPPPPPPSPHVFESPSPTAPPVSSYYVLATLGLRLHEQPEPASPVVAVLRPAAQLDATDQRKAAGFLWLHVHAHNSPEVDGWVVFDPTLLTKIAMQQHLDQAGGYSLLFPADWTYVAEGEVATFTGPDKSRLSVRSADSIAHLPALPGAPGRAEREEGPVDVYGTSPVITFYRLQAGGYELALNLLWAPGRAYQFSLRQTTDDSALFKQILASVIFR